MFTDSISFIFGNSKSHPNFMMLSSLPIRCFAHLTLAEISVRPQALGWEFQLCIFSGTTFRQTALPSRLYIHHIFHRNPIWLCDHIELRCSPQRHVQSLRWNTTAMLTVIDNWDGSWSYWTVCTSGIVLLWQYI